MGRLVLQSQVFYMPGTWGAAVPVPDAEVVFVDVDAPGRGNDDVWRGRTDSEGRFRGTSEEWQDSETGLVVVQDTEWSWHFEEGRVFDVSDALVLQVHITDGDKDTWLAYVHFDEHVQTPALVVPWGPEGANSPFPPEIPIGIPEPPQLGVLLASVNGRACMTPVEVNERVHAEIDARAGAIAIDVHDPGSLRILRGSGTLDELTAWAGDCLRIPEQWRPQDSPWADPTASGLSVGCAIVKTAAPASPLLVGVGVAVLYAVHHGYVNVSASGSRKVRGFRTPSVRFTLTAGSPKPDGEKRRQR